MFPFALKLSHQLGTTGLMSQSMGAPLVGEPRSLGSRFLEGYGDQRDAWDYSAHQPSPRYWGTPVLNQESLGLPAGLTVLESSVF